jgi:hypothetical protein
MSELELSVNDAYRVKRKYTKTGLNTKKYKAFLAKGKKAKVVVEQESKPVVNNYVDTSDPKYHSFEEHSTFKRCNGCGSVLRLEVTGCQYCVRKDRQG